MDICNFISQKIFNGNKILDLNNNNLSILISLQIFSAILSYVLYIKHIQNLNNEQIENIGIVISIINFLITTYILENYKLNEKMNRKYCLIIVLILMLNIQSVIIYKISNYIVNKIIKIEN